MVTWKIVGASKVSVLYIYRLSFVTKWIMIFNRLFDFVYQKKKYSEISKMKDILDQVKLKP